MKLKFKSVPFYSNIFVQCKIMKVYLCIFNVKIYKIKEYFYFFKSNIQKNIELENEQYRQFQRDCIFKQKK